MEAGGAPPRGARSDALRNRALLLTAAREVFAEQGVDASVESVVARSGLGTGTLYRHFRTREELIDALFEEHLGEIVEVVEHAAACDDPVVGLEELLVQIVALRRGDSVLSELLTHYPPEDDSFREMRAQIESLTDALIERGRRDGAIRADFRYADIAVLFWSLGPVLDATAEVAPEAWRRHVTFWLDGLRTSTPTPLPAPSLSPEQLAAATQRVRQRRFSARGRAR